MSGLFGSLDNSNGAINNHSTTVWSLIQTYLFYQTIMPMRASDTWTIINFGSLPPLGLGSSHFSLWNYQVSTLIDCLGKCHLHFSYSRLTKIVPSFKWNSVNGNFIMKNCYLNIMISSIIRIRHVIILYVLTKSTWI